MCLACEEMQMYYAYLDTVEEEKRKAQVLQGPWECEVVLFPAAGDTQAVNSEQSADANLPVADSKSSDIKSSNSKFSCDTPE